MSGIETSEVLTYCIGGLSFIIIALSVVNFLLVKFLVNNPSKQFKRSSIYIGSAGIALMAIFIIIATFRVDFYTKTKLGREYSIEAANEYLTNLYPKEKFKMHSMDSTGVVKYTVWINSNPIDKSVGFNIYSKNKGTDSSDIEFIPIYLPFN